MPAEATGIWPPYEAFYLESLLYCTNSALKSAEAVQNSLKGGRAHYPGLADWNEHSANILDGMQNIAIQAAALSRYFWPARSETIHSMRSMSARGIQRHRRQPNSES
jgi:hypothetical protein